MVDLFSGKKDVTLLVILAFIDIFIVMVALFRLSQTGASVGYKILGLYGVLILLPLIYGYVLKDQKKDGGYLSKIDFIIADSNVVPLIGEKKWFNGWSIFFGSLFLISILLFIKIEDPTNIISQTIGETYLPDLPQTIIDIDEENLGGFILDVEPASFIESVYFYAVMSLIFSLMELAASFFGYNSGLRNNIVAFAVVGLLLMGIGGGIWVGGHFDKYSEDESKLKQTYSFGVVTTFVWWGTQNIVPGILLHEYNNAYLSLQNRYGATDTILGIIMGVGAVSLLGLIFTVSEPSRKKLFKYARFG